MKADALTELFPKIPPPAVLSTWARLTALMRGQPRVIGLAPAITLTLLIGWVDWVTGWELSMFIFYAIPIVLAVWWTGGPAGLFMAIFSGVVCWIANRGSHTYETELGYSWAMLNREGYFCVVAFAVTVVRKKQDDDASRIRMLEELRQLEKDIVRVSEHEQQRIGQDLHDGLCQQLAAIGCATRVLADELGTRQLPESDDAAMIEESIQQAVMEARNLARGIFPVHVDRNGLSAALTDLARMTSRLTGVKIEVQEDKETHLTEPETAMHLYRIAQEAVANAVRHSGATEVLITLNFNQDTLALGIEDNGSGLFSQPTAHDNGMGLRTMHYRAQTLGAKLDIQPRPKGGTRVRCSLPTKNRSAL